MLLSHQPRAPQPTPPTGAGLPVATADGLHGRVA